MKVIIRDDDISFFTPPEFLEHLYEPLWSKGLPVCLSVIPDHYDSSMVAYRSSIPGPDENTPPREFGKQIAHPVWKNSRLTSLLSSLYRTGCVEVCVHGSEHRSHEFQVDAGRAKELLGASLHTLATAFPEITPKTFVPPYEELSSSALSCLAEHQLNLATDIDTARALNLVAADWHEDGIFETEDGTVVFVSRSYLFDPLKNDTDVENAVKEVLKRRPKLLIVANHYWDFFERFLTPKHYRITLWTRFVEGLMANDAVFTTFAQEAHHSATYVSDNSVV
jgi:hypothetical protein